MANFDSAHAPFLTYLYAAKQLQWELSIPGKPKAWQFTLLFQILGNDSTGISFQALDIQCFKPRADLFLCRIWKCLSFMLMQRDEIFFLICNNVFQHGKIVSHSTLFSAPGRTVSVCDSVTKVFITSRDLQFLGYVKEYINKFLWALMRMFLHRKLALLCFVNQHQCRS